MPEHVERAARLAAGVKGDDLAGRLRFLLEADRLKTVMRRSRLVDGSRAENSAEHSWHLALFALVLAGEAGGDVDLGRVMTMLVIHDIVEIDAGDTYIYDADHNESKAERERQAADRLFGLLPTGDAARLRRLWEEFEARETADARFAYAMDRLQPVLLNYASGGVSWREGGVGADQVLEVNAPIGDASSDLWAVARAVIADAVQLGVLSDR